MTAKADSKPFGIIYRITNKVNGKCYIGQTTMPLYKRWHAHKKATGRCVSISGAIQKYGVDAFEIKKIDEASTREELDAKEIAHIEAAKSLFHEFGYNLRNGGMCSAFSEETRALMSAKKKGRTLTAEHKAKIASSLSGVPKSKSHTANAATAKRGVKHSEQHRENMRKPRPDYVMSEAHKAAISKAATGAVFTEERRAKISAKRKAYLAAQREAAKI